MKMRVLFLSAVVLFATLIPSVAQIATSTTDVSTTPVKSIIKIGKGGWTVNEADVKEVNDILVSASFMGAHSEFADLLDADAIVLVNDKVMSKSQAVADVATRNYRDDGWPRHNFRITKTTVRGSLATLEAQLYVKPKNGQNEYFAVKNTFVRHKNGWRLLSSRTSTIKTPSH